MNSFGDLFWQAYLVNFLFWAGMAQGAVVLAATLNITTARWQRYYSQLARAFAGFLPVCVVLFAVLMLGRNHLFPWIAEPVVEKAAYLNVPFMAARGLLGLGALAWLSRVFLAKTAVTRPGPDAAGESAEESAYGGASPWSVVLALVFAIVYSYLAFDLIMSLQPHWHSTLLGAHFAVSAFYLGIAGLVFVGSLRSEAPREDRGNLAMLMFGISPFWMSLLWSQYIVIWYGDMPDETQFIYLRFYNMPWTAVTIAVIALAFVLPFVVLIPRRAKLMRATQLLASAAAVVGLLIEKYLMVVPSLSPDKPAPGLVFIVVTVGFAALFAACCRFSSRRAGSSEREPVATV